jgi:16S rRNA (cytosine1402-N4)-methyltransferase
MNIPAVDTHHPVMLDEIVTGLNIRPDGCYVDCTFGRGGHTAAILAKLSPNGRIVAFDRDEAAISARPDLTQDSRLTLIHQRFSRADANLIALGWGGRVDGILLDLGVSSPQLDDPQRGFSFRADGPLDMRMDRSCGESAETWLRNASETQIRECLWEYGEERMARKIAAKICAVRVQTPLQTTRQLAELVSSLVRHERRIDPATRTFQALRIMVNDELNELRAGLEKLIELLAVAGRILVLSFHSLEDRIVKRFFRDTARGPIEPSSGQGGKLFQLLTKKSQSASDAELASNPRARSARLRGLERIR